MPDQRTNHRHSTSHIHIEEREIYQHSIGKKCGLVVKLLISRSIRQSYLIVLSAFVLWFFTSYSATLHITNKNLIELQAEFRSIREGDISGDNSMALKIMDEKLKELGNHVRRIQDPENLQPILNRLHMTEKKVDELETQVQHLQQVHDYWISAFSIVSHDLGLWDEITTLQVPGQFTPLSETPESTLKDSTHDKINNAMLNFRQFLQMIEHFKTIAQDALKTCTKDKDGRRDFAFIQTGGSVIAGLTSKSISLDRGVPAPLEGPRRWGTLFAPLSGRPSVTLPEIVLTGDGSIGAFWAFNGSKGQLGIALSHPINIAGVTVEHIGKELAQDSIDAAPKDFELWGLVEDKDVNSEFFLFGAFYDTSKASIAQTFEFTPTKDVYNKVIFKINSNHGNQHHTCVYRVRIHGIIL
ncbi:uncharacterized protein MELLADRAFT_84107 [Melampsora larici-populina 98AG31]|uniref:SUN domain-containing protein n=1 Tax=Melampsora larici-populina (strain 98AG31 / pathotype 3-4-7) TaxID=747676 RepID=F4SBI7_MELLP|nr:uncharacterized protein MELLADRAFT_84107 [Melampsora larici-populina 98AG31]EGF97995.1 hypothetical protein MELLADRAFT_84107 [Melampsora larici-populina 98AG31]